MSYNLLIQTLKDVFESDDLVNTVVTGDGTQVDNFKKNLFPLIHIEVTGYQPVNINNTSMVQWETIITCVDIRDENKEEDRDKFWYNDNRHDNWNTTAYILRNGEVKMIKGQNDKNISLASTGVAEILSEVRENTLDGWFQTWSILVPDIYVKACDL